MKDLNLLEEKLLNAELTQLDKALGDIGAQLWDVFAKYEKIQGAHGKELTKYLSETVVSAFEPYYSGATTRPRIMGKTRVNLPEALKKVILEWATTDFLRKIEDVAHMVENTETLR